jgi:Uma2 family endonuclease
MSTVIRNINQLDMNKVYSYADYYSWRLKERIELIKGKIFRMSPAPSLTHQKISVRLSSVWYNYLKGKNCNVFAAPFDVRFPKKGNKLDSKIYTVVQPDVCVICDETKLDERGCIGAPDLIIEILSPGNSRKELKNKYELYLENNVIEYWVIHPYEQTLLIYTLVNEQYVPSRFFVYGDIVTSTIFKDFKLNLNTIFTKE